MSDFYLLDTYGGYKAIAIHPDLEVVAYDAGCMIIVWNLKTDSKICLQKNQHEVIHIQFIQTRDRFIEMLYSIDKSGVGCLWDLDSGLCVQEIVDRTSPLTQVMSSSNNQGYYCFAERDEDGSSYKLSIWTIERGLLALKAKSEEFTDEDLKAICTIPNFDKPGYRDDAEYGCKPTTSFKFTTIEEKCVKLWTFEDDLITTYKKINVKQSLVDAITSDIIGFIIILSSNGNLLILDSDGKYVSSLEREYLGFTSISCAQESLYLGTGNGTVHTYNVSTLIGSSSKKITNSNLLRPFDRRTKDQEDIESLFAQRVEKICSSRNGKRVLISFENKNFYVYNTRKEAIDGMFLSQHAEEIKAIEWVSQSGKSLVTVSDKLCLTKTKIADSGVWSSKSIDISEGLSNKLIQDRSKPSIHDKVALTCVCNNPIRQSQIFCGDNQGFVHIVEINRAEKLHTYNVSDTSINSITSNGYYILLVFIDGSCSVFDTALEFLSSIEKPFKKDISSLSRETKISLKARILDNSSNTMAQAGRMNQGLNNAHNFRIISLHSPSSLRLQSFDAEYKTKLFQCSYELEGLVAGFEIHPSNEYLIALSDQGFFYIFKLETGELRGKVPTMSDPLGIAIDPSGLYLALSVKNNSIDQDSQVRRKWMLKTEEYNSFRGSRTRILFYEVGTGHLASEISCLFEISSFTFSPNGKFFVAGSLHGCVSIWAIGERLQSTMAMTPDIWSSYPLYIKNEYIHEIEEANEEIRINNLNKHMNKQPIQTVVHHVQEPRRFERGFDHPHPRAVHRTQAPHATEHGGIGNDHQKLLREREMKFLREGHEDTGRKIEVFHRRPQENFRTVETPVVERPQPEIVTKNKPKEEIKEVAFAEPKRILTKQISPRGSESLVPPESAYFRVDEPTVQEEKLEEVCFSPTSQGSKKPEVGDSFEARARDSRAFENKNTPELLEKDSKTSRWDEYKDNSKSPTRRTEDRSPYSYPKIVHQMPVAESPFGPLAGYPQSMVYQGPDGRYIPYQHPIQVMPVRDQDSETRSDITPPYERERKDNSIVVDRSDDDRDFDSAQRRPRVVQHIQRREEPKRILMDRAESPTYVIENPSKHIIPPYRKTNDAAIDPPRSNLMDLYKRREQVNQPISASPMTITSPEKAKAQDAKVSTNILGRPREVQRLPEMVSPVPRNIIEDDKEIRPDPVDIDDDIDEAKAHEEIGDPEVLQKAFISGFRQPDTKPMSLQRFRREFCDDQAHENSYPQDIDKVSDSNYSIVEQAYKDMDDFDVRVDQHLMDKAQPRRVADPRSFRHKQNEQYPNRQRHLIRY
ncbi:unnamed protein product [Moneuplotes crassus]|uniref:Uncharacterized protein n=3 Tax=Euplotes crassus TaxID=5936 RepID=A0AAD1UC92_EUPCR|nr:unnamed protein product [Moneuplotes crassus]